MGSIYLIRHGETAWNVSNIFRGHTAIGLTPRGEWQARSVGKRMAGLKVARLYSSPLLRSMETARLAGEEMGLKPEASSTLIDVNYGDWTGLSVAEVEEKYPVEIESWKKRPLEFTFPGGESVLEVKSRTLKGLEEFASRGDSVALVSHLAVLKVAISALLGMGHDGFWRIRIDPASISEFERSGSTYLCLRLNDTSHLENPPAW